MRIKRSFNENRKQEYKKYNENYIKKYLLNNNLSNIRKKQMKTRIQQYRQNKNKYRLEKLNNKKRLRNLRQNSNYKKIDNFTAAKRMFNLRKNNYEVHKNNNLLRTTHLRTRPYFRNNERLKDRIYKRNKRMDPKLKKKRIY